MTRSFKPTLLLSLAVAVLTLAGCSALYDAGFRSTDARYQALANPDVSGLSEAEAEDRLRSAENHARRAEFIDRQRRLRQLGGGARYRGH